MNSKTNAYLSVIAIAAVVLLFGSILGHQALAYYGHYGHYHYHYHY